MATVIKWEFSDPAVGEVYSFEVNPSEGGSPTYVKNVTYRNTTAPEGHTLIFEGQDEPRELEWSGTILSQEQHETYIEWFQKRRQILVTDDLGREMWIYITEYSPTRERAVHYPWKHSYSIRATILDWVSVP